MFSGFPKLPSGRGAATPVVTERRCVGGTTHTMSSIRPRAVPIYTFINNVAGHRLYPRYANIKDPCAHTMPVRVIFGDVNNPK